MKKNLRSIAAKLIEPYLFFVDGWQACIKWEVHHVINYVTDLRPSLVHSKLISFDRQINRQPFKRTAKISLVTNKKVQLSEIAPVMGSSVICSELREKG